MPNLLLVLLPWLAVLALLALPSNHNARAWWIWAPLAAVAVLGAGLEAVIGNFQAGMVAAGSFGLGAMWLLGAALGRRGRAAGIVVMTLAFAAVSLLAFWASPLGEEMLNQLPSTPDVLWCSLLFALLSGLVYTAALNLTGCMCQKRFGGVRVMLRLLIWLWTMWVVGMGVFAGVLRLAFSGGLDWREGLVWTMALALLSFGLVLPFMVLSFSSTFYRERLQNLLRLPASPSPPAVAAPPTVTGAGNPQ